MRAIVLGLLTMLVSGCVADEASDQRSPAAIVRTPGAVASGYEDMTTQLLRASGEVYTDGCAWSGRDRGSGFSVCHYLTVRINNTGTAVLKEDCAGWAATTIGEKALPCVEVFFDLWEGRARRELAANESTVAGVVFRGADENDRLRVVWQSMADPMVVPDYNMTFRR